MSDYKFKKGDRCRVVSVQSGDPFKIGSIVTVDENDLTPFCVQGSTRYPMREKQLELVSEETTEYQPITPKVGEKYRVLKDLLHDNWQSFFNKGAVVTIVDFDLFTSDKDDESHPWFMNKDNLTTEYLELVQPEEGEPTPIPTRDAIIDNMTRDSGLEISTESIVRYANTAYEDIIKNHLEKIDKREWLYEPLIKPNNTFMSTLKKFARNLTLSEPKKSYIKHGLMHEDGTYTEDVRDLALTELVDAHIETTEFQEKLGKFVTEMKEDKTK